ncbi:MAG: caspase family protein [Burkholderiales bacterium]|nr:caspase family protein [Burkholderiales bacterium]
MALVIGSADYRTSPLVNPVNDATDIAKRLEEPGFKVILKLNASQREMKRAIREFSAALRARSGVGLFYFAGHGVQSKGRNYLLPVSADVRNEYELEDESVDANLVIGAMDEAQTRVSLVILDACRNNPLAKSFRSTQGGLAQMEAARGTLIGFATAPGSVAQGVSRETGGS